MADERLMLRILCFNTHGGYDMRGRRDLTRLHALLDQYDIDIAVLQEMETRASRGGALADVATLAGDSRPHRLQGLAMHEGEGWYGNLIVSRYPITRGLVHNLASARSLEPRNAVDALVDTPLGAIRIIGTHLSLTPWERWDEVRALVKLMNTVEETEKRPLLLMGDINEWRSRSRLLDTLNEMMTPIPVGRSFPSILPVLKLDRVWQDHCPFPVQARVLRDKHIWHLSDHLPLLVTIGYQP